MEVKLAITIISLLLSFLFVGGLIWLEAKADQVWQASWQGRIIRIYNQGRRLLRVTFDGEVIIEQKSFTPNDKRCQTIVENKEMGQALVETRIEGSIAHLLINGEDIPLVEAPRTWFGFAKPEEMQDPLVLSNPEFDEVEDERWKAAQQLMEAIRLEIGDEWGETVDQIYGTLRGLIQSRARLVASKEAYAALGTQGEDFEDLLSGLDLKIQNLSSGLQKLHFAALDHNLSSGDPALEEISELLLRLRADVETESMFPSGSLKEGVSKKDLARKASIAREKKP